MTTSTLKKCAGLLLSTTLFAACATSTQTGALAGAGGGGVLGAGIGALAGGKKGAVVGAALGGVAGGVSGALIGRYMDKQREEMNQDLKSGFVEKKGDKLVVKFDSGILFDTGEAQLKPDAQRELGEFARILNKYPDTKLTIEGFTDSVGAADYNKKLSKDRADAVTAYLTQAGVARARLIALGLGEASPVANNGSDAGRAKNRRVEIHIEANEELKQADAENASQRS